ncbi:MAG: accessory gene regulator B family protein [Ruminococcus flavefaciens]|nr:accessory gene regulator B family protein [Ruminococcus flavefaciens]MCM1362382.1 accessory gene regulator B family protein [Clostridiales bacterium]
MISKLAKNIAHFFVVQKIVEESREAIYAYGMELLLSDVLNALIVLLISLISHTLPAVIVFTTVFMGLRKFVGGYHANSHLSCIFTLVVVMLIFSYGICNVSEKYTWVVSIGFVAISIPVVFNLAPIPHPNKPVSDVKKAKLKKRSRIFILLLSMLAFTLIIFRLNTISLYVSSGIFLSAFAAVMGRRLTRR